MFKIQALRLEIQAVMFSQEDNVEHRDRQFYFTNGKAWRKASSSGVRHAVGRDKQTKRVFHNTVFPHCVAVTGEEFLEIVIFRAELTQKKKKI